MITNSYIKEASEILDNNSKIGIVYCNAEFFGEKKGEFKLNKPTIFNMLSQNRIFNSSMYRKQNWEEIGGYKPIMKEGCEDWELWISLLEKGIKPYKINKLYFNYRKLPQSREKNALEFKNYFNIRRKIFKLHKKLYFKYFPSLMLLGFRVIKKGLQCRK